MALFKVIRASAGSGKTFNLVGEYLRLLFAENDAFMHILAVTFTNKATEEMKTRIIRELFALASGEESKHLNGLMITTVLNEKQIRNRASNILKKILHKYSSFSVSTIDSFFQRIIRNFTRELGIQEGYSIELDTEVVLSDTIDKLMIQAGQDKELLSWLALFAESLIEKGENWNLKKGIRSLGKQIFKEEFKNLNETDIKLFSDRKFLNEYKSDLHALAGNIEKTYKEFGLKAIAILNEHGMNTDDFSNKNRGPAGFLVSLANLPLREPTATARTAAESVEKWYTSGSSKKSEIIMLANRELMPLMQAVIDYYEKNHRLFFTSSVILKNLFTLGILFDLSRLADLWCSENNAFLLNEAPGFLHRIIDGNDTPFIYEKAGFWYHHYMIDEFQDTSLLQWLNFKPLISNSLSQNFDNLAVGDTKQSIYRWRNSNWEILETRINKDFLPGIIDSVTLKENWRSRVNIINFNNRFFSSSAAFLQAEIELMIKKLGIPNDLLNIRPVTDLYRNMEQLPGGKHSTGGYVEVQYIKNEDLSDFYDTVNQKVLDLIFNLLEKGFHLSDIALLTRKNSESKLLADFLLSHANDRDQTKNRIDVISDEALRLGSSVIVNAIITLLQHIVNPLDRTNNYLLQSLYANYFEPSDHIKPWINVQNGKRSASEFILPDEFRSLADSPASFSLVEIIERIIRIFQLDAYQGELVYLMAFKDMANDFAQRNGCDISRFLEFWKETGMEKSISAPAGQDAIRILTIHKAKGLEFKITIIPYCSWEFNSYSNTILWCKPEISPFNKLPVIPISYTTVLQHTIFREEYLKEYYLQIIDNINLLYVAFTRAQSALYVFCKAGDDDQLKNMSDLSRKVLGNNNYSEGELTTDKSAFVASEGQIITYKPSGKINVPDRVRIAFQGRLMIDTTINKPYRPISEGKILHEIFTHIRYKRDVRTAVSRLHIQGKISSEEFEKYIHFIENAMKGTQISIWYDDNWKIINEAEIIIPNGTIKRPDRVITDGKQTIVIDYKFGTVINQSYEAQVKEYAGLLMEMGYSHVEGYIWYVTLNKIIACRLNNQVLG